MTNEINDHVAAGRKACQKTSNLARCYLELRGDTMKMIEESAAIALQGEAVATELAAVRAELNGLRAGGLDRLRAKSEADDKTMTLLRAEIAGLRARIAQGPTPLPQIDPEMISAGCALPAFDGMEEAQMVANFRPGKVTWIPFDPVEQARIAAAEGL